jgi:diguanylate cyclase (GGDEF)-like protein/PAS domain S-box-containing protein
VPARARRMNQYHLAVSGDRDGLWDWELASNRVHFSPRWLSMVGYDDGEVGNSPEEWLGRIDAEERPRVERELEAHLSGGASEFELRHRMRHRDGTYRWMACRGVVVRDGSGVAVRLVGSHTDVTADHLADPLTGLPNRELLLDRVTRSIDRARRNPDFLSALLLIGLEWPSAEQAPAPTADDPLLTASARRLETSLRGSNAARFPGDDYVLARLCGSQFALLLDGLNHVGEALTAAERVLAGLAAPLRLRGCPVFPRASIGIAVSATGYDRTDDLMRDAEAALYRARTLGGNRCEVFDIELVQSAGKRLDLEADLEQALEQGQLLLFYQPVVEAASGSIVGLEALARWRHPTWGMVPPSEFIPIAERTGCIVALESWTLREACRQLKAWQAGLPVAKDVWVSVNLSGTHFRHPGIVERVGAALRDAELDPACLVLELTESVVIEDPGAVKTLFMQLRVMGVRIAIDDFGTGHSSFAYLHQLPADFLKVDQSFTRGMEVRREKADIVGTVAGLAGQLGLHVIAEGIESTAGLELVRARQCGYLQGFLFSRPVDAGAAADLLRNGIPAPAGPAVRPHVPGSRRDGGRLRRARVLHTGAAALSLLLLMGLPARFVGEPVPPAPPSRPGAPAVAPPLVPPLAPLVPPVTVSAARGRTTDAAPPRPRIPEAEAASPAPAVVTFAMEHQHVFGSCRGVLRVSSAGVSFESDEAKDVFAFRYGRFESALGGDVLIIKEGKRAYRFKAGGPLGKSGGQPQLREAVKAINAFQPK